jgi:hypothetical protein
MQRLYTVEVRTVDGRWARAIGPVPMRTAKAYRAFLVCGTVARTVFYS